MPARTRVDQVLEELYYLFILGNLALFVSDELVHQLQEKGTSSSEFSLAITTETYHSLSVSHRHLFSLGLRESTKEAAVFLGKFFGKGGSSSGTSLWIVRSRRS